MLKNLASKIETLTVKSLSPTQLAALRQYYCVDGCLSEQEMLTTLVGTAICVLEVPTARLQDHIMQTHPEISEDWETWQEYHDYYTASGDTPQYSAKNRWPSIAFKGDENIFEDGWHRFHSYCRTGADTVPVILIN